MGHIPQVVDNTILRRSTDTLTKPPRALNQTPICSDGLSSIAFKSIKRIKTFGTKITEKTKKKTEKSWGISSRRSALRFGTLLLFNLAWVQYAHCAARRRSALPHPAEDRPWWTMWILPMQSAPCRVHRRNLSSHVQPKIGHNMTDLKSRNIKTRAEACKQNACTEASVTEQMN